MLVVGSTVLDDLPKWLVVDEIHVRLPVKDVLRCRAICKSWRSGTSTDAFILSHHRRQLSLPIIEPLVDICGVVRASNDLKMRPVLQCAFASIVHHATCDGLLILSQQSDYYICNPATRKWASLPHPPQGQPDTRTISPVGFYRHHPSGEHRVLWVSYPIYDPIKGDLAIESLQYFVLTMGWDQPRCIEWPTVSEQRFIPAICFYHCPPILHRGNLHWAMDFNITVFDTIAETFRQMSRPTQLGDYVSLLVTGSALALCRTDHNCVSLDVWVLQDYDAETWNFLTLTRHRLQESMISLPLFETQKEAMNKEPPFAFVL